MNWTVKVLDARGNVCTRINAKGDEEELVKGFDRVSAADRWADGRLFEGASDWYATVEHTTLHIHTVVGRGDAIARIMKQPRASVCARGTSSRTLGFGQHAKQDRVVFSHG
jgi:hypothetical protein